MENQQKLDLINEKVSGCIKCDLCQSRTKTVFGEGNPHADLVFVGEAPGADEDLSGRPFVGRSGKLLRNIASAMKWSEKDYYILNTLKCRPPQNRQPTIQELDTCRPYFDLQLKVINPKYIICWGKTAAWALLRPDVSMADLKMADIRQKLFDYGKAKVLCTYHPSYLLRAGDSAKQMVWSDLNFFVKETSFSVV